MGREGSDGRDLGLEPHGAPTHIQTEKPRMRRCGRDLRLEPRRDLSPEPPIHPAATEAAGTYDNTITEETT